MRVQTIALPRNAHTEITQLVRSEVTVEQFRIVRKRRGGIEARRTGTGYLPARPI